MRRRGEQREGDSLSGAGIYIQTSPGARLVLCCEFHYFRIPNSTEMRALLAVAGVALICAVWAADEKKPEAAAEERPSTFRRLIPADVLRDFPGHCFASTKCATIEPGHSWELAPFCGRSTCVKAEEDGRLLELVEDCGPLPKANPKCKLSEKTNKTAAFPDCCPQFECEKGVKLEYPEIPTPPPPKDAPKA